MSGGLGRENLRPIQQWGAERIRDHEATILAWDMGAGKGVTTLTGIVDCLEAGIISKVLVVAPLLVATTTWPDEIEQWEHTRHLDYAVIRVEDDDVGLKWTRKDFRRAMKHLIGWSDKEADSLANRFRTWVKESRRGKIALGGEQIHIINKQGLPWLWSYFGSGKRWPYDALVVDEASMFKNGRKKTDKGSLSEFGAAAKARKHAKRTVLLTGTPTPKGLRDLWGLAYVADLGERLGTARTRFEARWFTKSYDGFGFEAHPNAKDEITERLSDIMFTLSPEDYPKTHGVIYNPVFVNLSSSDLAEYRRFKETLVSKAHGVEAVNGAALLSKLLQFANGSLYREDGNDVRVHDEKLKALERIIEEASGEPVLVAYSYKFDRNAILRKYPKAAVFDRNADTRRLKRDWNDGKIPLMIAHPASIGHGQNIQFGGNIAVWYGLTNDLELYLQFNRRLDRPGQPRPVFLHHILARGTYDETLMAQLGEKALTQDDIMREFWLKVG